MSTAQHVPVLIAGGGMVGLSAALLLEYHSVPYVLVERRTAMSVLPRSRGLHTRSAEIYRQIGAGPRLEQVAATALAKGQFGGAWQGSVLTDAQPLDISRVAAAMAAADPSPSRFLFLPQVLLEPVLADLARNRGGDLRFGVELTGFRDDGDGVCAELRAADGVSTRLRADYLVAADGAGSTVRRALGIGGWELPPTHHLINVFARTDLTGILHGQSFSQCEITGERVRGLVLSKNNTDEWSFHIEYDPNDETVADYPEQRCAELIREMVGVPGLEVEVLARSAWDTGVFVADDYRRGRVFLAGDAAHRHAPWGGFNGNTGIADAHNLTWKLAAVLSGVAGPALLDSYVAERRPRALVAAEQARLGTDFRTRYGIETPDNAEDLAKRLDIGEVMVRYRYRSTAVAAESTASLHVGELKGQNGTRIPHLWIDAAETVSTLDLCGPGFALLVAGTSAAWRDAAARAQRDTGIELAVHALPRDQWTARTDLPPGGALLVRPDMHVAARSETGLTPATLTDTLRAITGLAAKADAAVAVPMQSF
ncbi:FAD-dependent monooxygenase [Nocardia jiangxiensis]|uniref:FAD-dependent monooxygenase n=1 Tax=Nocardia jiangxiensis TaxID=282685 RepID=A0ABW6RYF9_9NOCA